MKIKKIKQIILFLLLIFIPNQVIADKDFFSSGEDFYQNKNYK